MTTVRKVSVHTEGVAPARELPDQPAAGLLKALTPSSPFGPSPTVHIPVDNPALVLQAPETPKKKTFAEERVELEAVMIREMERVSGKSLAELAKIQAEFIGAKAKAAGLSVGAYLRRVAEEEGYGGVTATWWPSLSTEEKAAWQARFDRMMETLRKKAPQKLKDLLAEVERLGGGIRFEPQKVEELEAYAFVENATLGVGREFLLDAEADISRIYANVEHEFGGHTRYGDTVSMRFISKLLAELPEAERKLATGGAADLDSAFGYPETEVYAELHELEYRTPMSGGDDPNYDIPSKLRDLQKRFAPEVALALVKGFRLRVQRDPSVTERAKEALDRHISAIFGFDPAAADH